MKYCIECGTILKITGSLCNKCGSTNIQQGGAVSVIAGGSIDKGEILGLNEFGVVPFHQSSKYSIIGVASRTAEKGEKLAAIYKGVLRLEGLIISHAPHYFCGVYFTSLPITVLNRFSSGEIIYYYGHSLDEYRIFINIEQIMIKK